MAEMSDWQKAKEAVLAKHPEALWHQPHGWVFGAIFHCGDDMYSDIHLSSWFAKETEAWRDAYAKLEPAHTVQVNEKVAALMANGRPVMADALKPAMSEGSKQYRWERCRDGYHIEDLLIDVHGRICGGVMSTMRDRDSWSAWVETPERVNLGRFVTCVLAKNAVTERCAEVTHAK